MPGTPSIGWFPKIGRPIIIQDHPFRTMGISRTKTHQLLRYPHDYDNPPFFRMHHIRMHPVIKHFSRWKISQVASLAHLPHSESIDFFQGSPPLNTGFTLRKEYRLSETKTAYVTSENNFQFCCFIRISR